MQLDMNASRSSTSVFWSRQPVTAPVFFLMQHKRMQGAARLSAARLSAARNVHAV